MNFLKIFLFLSIIFAFKPQTKTELQIAADLWINDNASALEIYGRINTWDTSLITDISELFDNKHTFNDDISNWDISNVSDVSKIFNNADAFNQDLSSWNVSSVTNMSDMFSFTASLSDENKCSIHTAWIFNEKWEYDWSEFCPICDEGYTEINGICYNSIDLAVLQDIIYINESLVGEEPLNTGWQQWENGRIRILSLEGLELVSIPTSIGDLDSIISLSFCYNQISIIPESIANLNNLIELGLHHNQINNIPANIGELSNLTVFHLSFNEITSVPESIGDLNNLDWLWLNDNLITSLPDNICLLPLPYMSNFSFSNNSICPPYPYCITEEMLGDQDCYLYDNLGDINLDSEINITDIVSIIYFILDFVTPTELQQILSDYNSDGQVNITDVMLMVMYIIE